MKQKTLLASLTLSLGLSFPIIGIHTQEQRSPESDCDWFKTTYGDTPYQVCVFVSRGENRRNYKEIFYIPPFLFVERPDMYGIYFEVRRYRVDQEAKNLLIFDLLLKDPRLEQELLQYYSPDDEATIHHVIPSRLLVKMKIPQSNRWISSSEIDQVSFPTLGGAIQVSFALNHKETEAVLNHAYYESIEFQITFDYASEETVVRYARQLTRYVFPDEILDEIFGDGEYANISEWQLFELWNQAKKEIQIHIVLTESDNVQEYLALFLDWTKRLTRNPNNNSRDWHGHLAFQENIERNNLHRNREDSRLKEHELLIKARQHPHELTESEKRDLKQINLIHIKKNDLIGLREEIHNLSTYLSTISQYVVTRTSRRDRIQAPERIGNPNPLYQRFSYPRGVQSVTGLGDFTTRKGIKILGTHSKEIRLQFPNSRIYTLTLSTTEVFEQYEEAPEENCLRLYVWDPFENYQSTFCIDFDRGDLTYQRLDVTNTGMEIILRPQFVLFQEKEDPQGEITRYENLSGAPLQKVMFFREQGMVHIWNSQSKEQKIQLDVLK